MNRLAITIACLLCCAPSRGQDFDRSRAVEEKPVAVAPEESALALGGLGLVSFREGLLARRPGELPDWLDAPLRSRVEEGDRVRTGPQGRAEIQFQERNVLRLAPATTLRLTQLAQEEVERAITVDLELEKGELWAELEDLDAQDDFKVRSQVMGAAITGTGFRLSVDERRETVLSVLHGEVRVAADDAGLARDPAMALSVDSLRSLLGEPRATRRKGPPVPVAGPHAVAGPHEVSLQEWMVIVRDRQQIRVGADGKVRAAGALPAAEGSAWERWNLQRNKALSPQH
jgi:hypothetical protein